MTDHAKALADALRNIIPAAVNDSPGGCKGDAPGCETCDAIIAAKSALAAYESRPAEAATRENGDPLVRKFLDRRSNAEATLRLEKQELAKGKDWVITQEPVSCREIVAVCAVLSTHQQQGAETKTALQKFADLWNDDCCEHPASTRADRIERMLMTVLSRTPQPKCATCKDTQTVWDGEFNIQCPDCAQQPDTVTEEMVDAFRDACDAETWRVVPCRSYGEAERDGIRAGLTAALAAHASERSEPSLVNETDKKKGR